MGAKDIAGTPLSLIIGGPSFRAFADADIAQMLAEWKTEGQATSGEPMWKMIKQLSEAEGVDVAANVDELVIISAFAESRLDIPLGFVTASGTLFMGKGRISCDAHSHANNKLPVKFMYTTKPVKVG